MGALPLTVLLPAAWRWVGMAALGASLALVAGCVPTHHHDSSSPASAADSGDDGGGGTAPETELGIALEEAFPGLVFDAPIAMLQPPGDATRWFVVERAGRVRVFSTGNPAAVTVYADLTDRISTCGEGGLLGMAFHPDYPATREVFLSYTQPPCNGLVSTVARYAESGGVLDTGSAAEVELLTVTQPFDNHDGGAIVFGPDGLLYIALGDGGSGGDPLGNGQSLQTLLGKLLRIDVDDGEPYGIPADNPFVGALNGERKEIFAYGLRNPWRFSFDRQTGGLWLADVGQDNWEEVDRVVGGGNYGWSVTEGTHCYRLASGCDQTGLTLPVAEYSHDSGCAVSGGYVYRGTQFPALAGRYLYGDFCSGKVWGLSVAGGDPQELADTDSQIVGFAEGADGELYLLDYGSGHMYHIVPAP